MYRIFTIAFRNLLRYKRRTMLTSLLITLGIVLVILFSGLAGSFKTMMIGQITDSNLSQMQIHKRGYVSSIDTMPLHLTLDAKRYKKIEGLLSNNSEIKAWAPRIKLNAMLSNFTETTNIRLNAINPEKEVLVCPDVATRMTFDEKREPGMLLNKGEVIIPDKLAKGMKLKIGDAIVLVANNKDGSVNGLNFKVAGIIESILGPQGKEGYMHIKDAQELLRMDKPEMIEVAIRLHDFDKLGKVYADISSKLAEFINKKGMPEFEIHTWDKLSPFSNIAKMIDFMTITMKIIMIAIVLISILNVMMMSVYERVREIGTMSAIGTAPSRIMGLFLAEGLLLGLISTIIGNVIGLAGIFVLNIYKISFAFGRQDNLLLAPTVNITELLWVSCIVLLISVFASLQPAYKASRMEPVDALGHV
ncbi:MAG: ABC transporter permease [Desulfobacula sp.]|jgi:putative ABC transport system permease protein|uniref:ABC transporter permease n=1 Tax=Desulfobacula sp. TaxID=2593537 RepID=UPI001E0F1741|nr:ABC transporter permease [Desulfobacula sp.]MBT3485723.1 ABC transporter permease [Desulfobacula sp.]MBT3805144.1 ABC transporter permease [Desulfobacula sp.]MBT4198123.1 ABC transporter permease [Desulfobacula sp.]MBT4508133.1 ABC transporter permease [Desulfobacula sp.]